MKGHEASNNTQEKDSDITKKYQQSWAEVTHGYKPNIFDSPGKRCMKEPMSKNEELVQFVRQSWTEASESSVMLDMCIKKCQEISSQSETLSDRNNSENNKQQEAIPPKKKYP